MADTEILHGMSEAASRSQKKRDSSALQKLGEELCALPQSALKTLELPEILITAITDWKKMGKGEARRRQMQYIGRLMREEVDDADAVIHRLNVFRKNL